MAIKPSQSAMAMVCNCEYPISYQAYAQNMNAVISYAYNTRLYKQDQVQSKNPSNCPNHENKTCDQTISCHQISYAINSNLPLVPMAIFSLRRVYRLVILVQQKQVV